METIDTFVQLAKSELTILQELHYQVDSSTTNNENDKDLIYHRLEFKNRWINRDITFDFEPRQRLRLNVIITDTKHDVSFTLNGYLIYQQAKEPVLPPYERFSIQADDFVASLTALLRYIDELLSGELRPVIAGNQMVDVPVIDMRDFY